MADELMRSKHGFGKYENVAAAIESGAVDEFDLLLTENAEGKAKFGWVRKDGTPIFLEDVDTSEIEASVEALETEMANKANVEEIEAKFAEKANSEDIVALETELAKKANAEEIEAKMAEKANAEEVIAELATKANAEEMNAKFDEIVAESKSYTDGKIESAVNEHLAKKYEFTDVPVGTLVDYREDEIRIMCPADAVFTKQAVGAGGDVNSYYGTLKTYAPCDEAVGYIEHLGDQVDAEILTDLKTDAYGRRYQPSWLALAKCDDDGNWTYYGASSSKEKYIGWDYQIDWYNADGVMIASDSIRINLSNEDCHHEIKPYYVNGVTSNAVNEAKLYTDEQIAALNSAFAVVEF